MPTRTLLEELSDSIAAIRKDKARRSAILMDCLDGIEAVLADFEKRLANLEAVNIQVKADGSA